jgi:hypothetical protein
MGDSISSQKVKRKEASSGFADEVSCTRLGSLLALFFGKAYRCSNLQLLESGVHDAAADILEPGFIGGGPNGGADHDMTTADSLIRHFKLGDLLSDFCLQRVEKYESIGGNFEGHFHIYSSVAWLSRNRSASIAAM